MAAINKQSNTMSSEGRNSLTFLVAASIVTFIFFITCQVFDSSLRRRLLSFEPNSYYGTKTHLNDDKKSRLGSPASAPRKKLLALESSFRLQDNATEYDLCLVSRYYTGQRDQLMAFLGSIYGWGGPEKVLVRMLVTEKKTEQVLQGRKDVIHAKTVLENFYRVGNSSEVTIELSRAAYSSIVGKGYQAQNKICAVQDYGYVLTDLELDFLTQSDDVACKYLVITNADNIYSRYFSSSTRSSRIAGTELIGVFFVSHNTHIKATDIKERAGTNILMRSKMKYAGIDLGACLFKSEVFTNPDYRFCKAKQVVKTGDVHGADGHLIAQIVDENHGIYKTEIVDQILFLHQ